MFMDHFDLIGGKSNSDAVSDGNGSPNLNLFFAKFNILSPIHLSKLHASMKMPEAPSGFRGGENVVLNRAYSRTVLGCGVIHNRSRSSESEEA
jgi:hypothetical protein